MRLLAVIVRILLTVFLPAAWPAAGLAQGERVVEIPTRANVSIRALLQVPDYPRGSVILLAGGHGKLDISTDGQIGWGSGNQLVRTRAMYARNGFATLVPDIAPDLKTESNVVRKFRWSAEHATDIGNLVAFMRTVAEPVHLIGTSRAALSVASAGVRLARAKAQRADSLVITSGMLMHERDQYPSAQTTAGNLAAITQPVLLIAHEGDGCFVTPPSGPRRFAPLLSGAERVDIIVLSGGEAGTTDPCGAKSHHGFLGIDDLVVQRTVDWLAARGRR